MEVLPTQLTQPTPCSDRPGMVSGVARLQGLPLGTMWKGRALALSAEQANDEHVSLYTKVNATRTSQKINSCSTDPFC